MKASQRIRVRAFAWVLTVVLAVCAVVFLSLAGYLQLAAVMPRPRAALVTGLVLVGLTAIVLGGAYWISVRQRRHRRERARDDFEEMLETKLDPMLRDWIDRHPESAAAGTLLLGIAAGYSGSVRRVLQEFYDNYAETERRRREKHGS